MKTVNKRGFWWSGIFLAIFGRDKCIESGMMINLVEYYKILDL
jgi:hypothetical protein